MAEDLHGKRVGIVTRARGVTNPRRLDETGTSVIIKPVRPSGMSTRIEGYAEPGIEVGVQDVVIYVPAGRQFHPIAKVVRVIDPASIHDI